MSDVHLELDSVRAERDSLSALVDKLSAERDAALAARETIKKTASDLITDARSARVAAEVARDKLRSAIVDHRACLLGGLAATQDLNLWHAAGLCE